MDMPNQRLNGANAEGYKRPVDDNGGNISKTVLQAKIRNFWPKKKHTLLYSNLVQATTGQSCQKEKVPFSQMNISLLGYLGGLV